MSKKPATIHDVARLAGISLSTASRAINLNGRVSQETIQKVKRITEEIGYTPNSLARGMRNNKSNVVGLILSNIANPFYIEIIRALEIQLREEGYGLLIGSSENDRKKEIELMNFFRSKGANLIILGPCDADDYDYVSESTSLDRVIFFDRPGPPHGVSVCIDHGDGARIATQRLIQLGRKRISVVMSSSTLQPTNARLKGVEQAFQENGMVFDPNLTVRFKTSVTFVPQSIEELMQSPQRPDAFLCLGTRMLSGVITVMKKIGMQVPRDVSIVSIGDTDFSRYYDPPISAISWNADTVVEHFMAAIHRMDDEEDATEGLNQVVPCGFIERSST